MQDRFKFRFFNEATKKMVYDANNHAPQATLMQCTGLKDKNGKLIYEGDIVKFKTPRTGLRIGQVKFDADCALFEVRYLDITNDWELMDKYNYEVIGNIYENPELLEAKDANTDV